MIKRTIEEVVRKSLRTFPVTALVGARQVGKSTLSDYIGKGLGFTYVSLDDLTLKAEANADPRFFPHPSSSMKPRKPRRFSTRSPVS